MDDGVPSRGLPSTPTAVDGPHCSSSPRPQEQLGPRWPFLSRSRDFFFLGGVFLALIPELTVQQLLVAGR